MRAQQFTDAIYHGENNLEFDPRDVVAIEERTERLWLRGKHPVTQITLKSGTKWVLRGSLKAQIERERREALSQENTT